jgi:hypothetical protein
VERAEPKTERRAWAVRYPVLEVAVAIFCFVAARAEAFELIGAAACGVGVARFLRTRVRGWLVPSVSGIVVALGIAAAVLAPPFHAARRASEDGSVVRAVLEDDAGAVASALSAGTAPDRPVPPRGWSLLTVAASNGNVATMQVLLDRGANVNHRGLDGVTPLIAAAAAGQREAVALLLRHGADKSAREHNGATARDLAEVSGHADVVAVLDE